MALTLDTLTLGAPQVAAAHTFYASVLSPARAGDEHPTNLDVHGGGQLALQQIDALATEIDADPATSGFRGFAVSLIVGGPGEVEALLATAAANGASVIKPPKKQLFGEFTATWRAPDGAVWKLAASSKKDTGPVPETPRPNEGALYLGVSSPKAASAFYTALGMRTDHDYGDKFIDFATSDGVWRLGLLPRKGLAKDVGVGERGDGFSAVVLTHLAASREDVDALLAAAASAGGRVTAAAAPMEGGRYAGYLTDPDGFHWRITTQV